MLQQNKKKQQQRLRTNVVFLMTKGPLIINYCFMGVGSKAACLLCRECVRVFNEYNLKKYHQTKHLCFGHNLTKQERKRKCKKLINNLKKQQTVFTKLSLIQDAATVASLVMSHKIVKVNNLFFWQRVHQGMFVRCSKHYVSRTESKIL